MSTPKTLRDSQAKVIHGIIGGLTITACGFAAGYALLPERVEGLETPVQRLVFTFRWQSLSLFTLLFGVLKVANKRFATNAIDPTSGNDKILDIDQRFLQNTLEQLIISATGQLILCTYLQPETASRVIPTLTLLFVCGRTLFWIGYNISPVNRALGFVMTAYPSAIVAVTNIVFLFYYGPNFAPVAVELYLKQ